MLKSTLKHLAGQPGGKALQLFLTGPEMVVFSMPQPAAGNVQLTVLHHPLLIHFYFTLEGRASLHTGSGQVQFDFGEDIFCLHANPRQADTLSVQVAAGARLAGLLLSMRALHEVFGSSFGKDPAAVRQFAEGMQLKEPVSLHRHTPGMLVAVHQLFNDGDSSPVRQVLRKARIMEFLALYWDNLQGNGTGKNECPFVLDTLELKKIEEARRLIVSNLHKPPSLKELARQVGTNEYKLKVGFRHVYGTTVYGYLTDYRMEEARRLLLQEKPRVNEIALRVGYANTSHFIAAYKKKYGITPKQHLKSVPA